MNNKIGWVLPDDSSVVKEMTEASMFDSEVD